jgi:hypothetical protein
MRDIQPEGTGQMSPLIASSAVGRLDDCGNVLLDITTKDGETLTLQLEHPEVTRDTLARAALASRRIQGLDMICLLSAKVARAETLLECSRAALEESAVKIEELACEESAERRERIRDSIKDLIRGALDDAFQCRPFS